MRFRRLLPALAFILSISLLALLSDPPPEQASASSFDAGIEYGIMANETGSGGSGCDFSAGDTGATTVRTRQGPTSGKRCTFTSFNLTTPDANFAAIVTFVPQDFTAPCTKGHSGGTCPGPLGVGTVSEIPNGAIVAKLVTKPTLGLVNNACDTTPDLQFKFVAANTDITDTFTYDPVTQGLDNALSPGHPSDATAYWPGYSDGATTAGVGDALNGIEAGAEKYPAFLNTYFDPDGVGVGVAAVQPRARFYSHSFVVGTGTPVAGTQVLLQLIYFEPGALTTLPGLQNLTADLGYPVVTILQDTTVPTTPSSVTDFCSTLLSATITYGRSQENPCNNSLPSSAAGVGCPRSTVLPHIHNATEGGAASACAGTSTYEGNCDVTVLSSTTGTKAFRTLSGGQRDAENDGVENGLDPCPYSSDAGWSPRAAIPTGDSDVVSGVYDGIPDSCDAVFNTVLVGLNDNESDDFVNRLDICSTVSNAFGPNPTDRNQSDGARAGEVDGAAVGLSLLAASDIKFPSEVPDGGPRTDSIGAACDDSDRDAREGVHGTFGIRPKGSCADGRDNDGDTLIDFNDPSCTTTIDVAGDGLYDANDTNDDNDGILDCGPDATCGTLTTPSADDDQTAARPNGHYHSQMRTVRVCINSTGLPGGSPADSDSDGVCAGTTGESDASTDSDSDGDLDTVDNCLAVSNANQADMDNDGTGDFCDSSNTNGPAGPFITLDSDGDSFINAVEIAASTDPNARCGGGGNTIAPFILAPGSWPADLAVGTEADVGFVDGTDLTAIAGQFGLATTAGGGTAPERYDLGPVSTTSGTLTLNKITDNFVDGTDLTAVSGQFGLICES